MAEGRAKESEESGNLTEAEIAVHWKEEEYLLPSPKFTAQANLTDPAIMERFSLDRFPECFRGVRRPAHVGPVLAYHARHEHRPVLQVVRRREAERLRELPSTGTCRSTGTRPPSSSRGSRKRSRPISITYQELWVRVNEFAAVLARLLPASGPATG